MDDDLTMMIPSDDEGYVLLQCEHCGTYFKACPNDIEDDSVLHLFCPSCGLISKNYVTDDVLKLASSMVSNYAQDLMYNMFKEMEKQSKNSIMKIKTGKMPRHDTENPLRAGIEALDVTYFSCCKRAAKVKPLLKMTGCYCPFCGVKNYEIE